MTHSLSCHFFQGLHAVTLPVIQIQPSIFFSLSIEWKLTPARIVVLVGSHGTKNIFNIRLNEWMTFFYLVHKILSSSVDVGKFRIIKNPSLYFLRQNGASQKLLITTDWPFNLNPWRLYIPFFSSSVNQIVSYTMVTFFVASMKSRSINSKPI